MNEVRSGTHRSVQELIAEPARVSELKQLSADARTATLTQRQLCDLELLLNGAYSPLGGFMSESEYAAVLERVHLPDGSLWPIPITLDVGRSVGEKLQPGDRLALQDGEGFCLAVLNVSDVWEPDKHREAEAVFGTGSLEHPGVRHLLEQTQPFYVGGRVEGIQLPVHYDFEELRHTPNELRALFERIGWRRVLAFHTCKPMHRVHREVVMDAARQAQAHILLHPASGVPKPGDLHYFARVNCYRAIVNHFPHHFATLSLLPMAVRMAGPREAILNALVRWNYGCTHMVVGPHHASPPDHFDRRAKFYSEYAAQEAVARVAGELGIEIVPVQARRYVPARGAYVNETQIKQEGLESVEFDEFELRTRLARGRDVPAWYSYPDVIEELRKVCPPRSKQGFTLFFTGLSGAGKSTLAKIMYAKFIEAGGRPVTLLDGDIVRKNLSSELGFSKEHRDLNVRRIGFVAAEITKNGGIAICAPIAPYAATRQAVREMIEEHGGFIEIHVATPLEVCEDRDRKGLYKKARAGIIPEFTGVSDPYEAPVQPELRIDTSNLNPMQAAQEIALYLLREGYLET